MAVDDKSTTDPNELVFQYCDMFKYANDMMLIWKDRRKTAKENNEAFEWVTDNNYNPHSAVSIEIGVVMGMFGLKELYGNGRFQEILAVVDAIPIGQRMIENEKTFTDFVSQEYKNGLTPVGYLKMVNVAYKLTFSKDKLRNLEHKVTWELEKLKKRT